MCDSINGQEQPDCEVLVDKGGNRVLLHRDATKEFWALDVRHQARLLANMELWTDDRVMTEKQFNGSEGRAKSGDINRMLMAFKIRKIRCYGFICPLNGRKTFIIVDIDPAKKDQKGKPRILERAKARVIAFENKYGEQYA